MKISFLQKKRSSTVNISKMKYNINLLPAVIVLFLINMAYAQNCTVPERIQNGKLAVELKENTFQAGIMNSVTLHFKTPETSTEVRRSDWLECEGFMPGGVGIKYTKILSVEGLPEGLTWYSNRKDNIFPKAESGCLTIEGTTHRKGTYPITIKLQGVGGLLGIKKKYNCFIEKFNVLVK